MARLISSLALLSLSTSFGLASGHGPRADDDALYRGHSLHQPVSIRTVTITQASTVTVASCNAVYLPSIITVYTGCSSASAVSSVSGFPISSQTSHGPWSNATAPPCTHGLSTSTALTAPGNTTTSLGSNHTTLSHPSLTGTAGTTFQTAEPIGTSSFPWRNSTSTSTTENDSTSVLTVTLTSPTVVTVGTTLPAGHTGSTAPSPGYGTGTGLSWNTSISASTDSSYQPSLTYHTTAPASSSSATHHTTRNVTVTVGTSTRSLPSGWSISTVSTRRRTSLLTSRTSSALTHTPSPSSSSATTLSTADITTETNAPIFTTTSRLSSSTHAPLNTTLTSTQGWSNTTTTAAVTANTALSSLSSTTAGGSGDQYGGYTYGSPFPATSSSASEEPGLSSVDAIGGASTTRETSTGIGTTAVSSTTQTTQSSTFPTATVGMGGTRSTGTAEATTVSQSGGEYGYYGEYYQVARA